MDKKNTSKRRTPNSKKAVKKVDSKENLSLSELKGLYKSLNRNSVKLDREIAQLKSEGVTDNLKPEMQALHDYNDIKDVTQVVLGYLADIENCTITDLYTKYSLPAQSN